MLAELLHGLGFELLTLLLSLYISLWNCILCLWITYYDFVRLFHGLGFRERNELRNDVDSYGEPIAGQRQLFDGKVQVLLEGKKHARG
jgi:hypothetical protein